MSWLTPDFSIDDAIATGQDVYDILVSNWGYRSGPPGIVDGLQFPPIGQAGISTSLAGLAIGPRSTVDRAWVTWNMEKKLSAATTSGSIRRLAVDSPLLYTIPARRGITPGVPHPDPVTAQQQGNLYLFPQTSGGSNPGNDYPAFEDSTVLPSNYLRATPDGGGSQVLLTLGVGLPSGVFVAPLLHIVAYLKPGLAPAPTARFPLLAHGPFTTAAMGAEQILAQIPTYGRKHIVISFDQDGTMDYRVGALRSLAIAQSGTIPATPSETTEAAATGVTKWVTTKFVLDHPNADYLILYGNSTAATGVHGGFTIAAYD